jgi:uncharacterized lipoprotein YmbA
MPPPISFLGLLATTMLVSACGSAGPPPRIYVLGELASNRPASVSEADPPIVEVKSVRLPDFLDTTEIVTRRPGGEIIASKSAQWGERLSIGLTRTVALSLAGSLPQLVVMASPPLDAPQWQVLIDIDAFDAQVDGPCTLMARWSIWEGRGNKKVSEGRLLLNEPIGTSTDAHVVAAMNRAVDELANRIARQLQPYARH